MTTISVPPYSPNNIASYFLQQGQEIHSVSNGAQNIIIRDKNRRFSALVQNDGNFVIFTNDAHHAVWSTGTNQPHNSNFKLSFTDDGNLLLQDTVKNVSTWNSNAKTSKSNGPFFAELNSNGQLVIYDNKRHITWYSKNFGRSGPSNPMIIREFSRSSVLSYYLIEKQYLKSDTNGGYMFDKNKNVVLKIQVDGNILIYSKDNNGIYSQVLWSTGTVRDQSEAPFTLNKQNDGNLVATNNKNESYWQSNSSGLVQNGYYAELTTTGQLVIHDRFRDIIWINQ